MQIITRAAIGAGSLAAAGYGATQLAQLANQRTDREHAELQQATAESRQQWDAWKARLESEFPGGALPTPQEHARFEQFLATSPAPRFVDVEHEGFTRVHLSCDSLPVPTDLVPPDFQKLNGYPVAFGGMMALGGAFLLGMGVVRGARSNLATTGLLAGGAALAAFGGASLATGIHGFRVGEGTEGARKIAAEINSY